MLLGLLSFAASFALFASVMLAGLNNWLPAVAIFPLMIITRSVYGLLGSGTQPASQAYVADRTTPVRLSFAEGEVSMLSNAMHLQLREQVKFSRAGIALAPESNDGQIFRTAFPRVNRANFPAGRGLFVSGGRVTSVQIGVVASDGLGGE